MKQEQQPNHPILTIKRYVSSRISPEHHQVLEQERDKVLEKAIILYDAAIKSPQLYFVIKKEAKALKLYDRTDKMKAEGTLDPESLLYKYVDLAECIRFAHSKYDTEYGESFASTIIGTVADARIFITKAVETTLINQPKEKHSGPKKSVTIREDLNQEIKITKIENSHEHKVQGEWTQRVKRQKLSPTNQTSTQSPD
jgi:hypothetical protein